MYAVVSDHTTRYKSMMRHSGFCTGVVWTVASVMLLKTNYCTLSLRQYDMKNTPCGKPMLRSSQIGSATVESSNTRFRSWFHFLPCDVLSPGEQTSGPGPPLRLVI